MQRHKHTRKVILRQRPLRFFAKSYFAVTVQQRRLKIAVIILFLFVLGNVAQAQVRLDFDDAAPILESGTALGQGARYRFRDVAPGTDALVTLTTITGGTTLLAPLDDNATSPERFQPVIRTTAANTIGYVRFDFQLVKAGTSIPRTVPGVRIAAQDIDGTSTTNREFVEYVGMQTTSVASPTTLVPRAAVVPGGTSYVQQSPGTNQAGIGTGNNFEFYGMLSDTATNFTVIAGNVVGTANCTANDNNCNRLNSYAFDAPSSNLTQPAPDVSITKTGPASVNQNGTVTYMLVARNNGATTAHGATVTDNVPAALTNVTITCAATGGAVCPATAGLTTLSNEFVPTFPNGGQLTFTITGTAATAGTLTNTATVAAPNGSTDPTPANNTSATITTTVVSAPDLTIAKTHVGDFTRGSTGTYTLTVTNAGSAATSGSITVTDTLPAGLTVNGGAAGTVAPGGANAANWVCNSNAAAPQIVTCTSSTVIPATAGSNKSIFSLTINVAPSAPASVTNNASVSGGGEPAASNGNNTASDPTTTIAAAPNVVLSKSCPIPATCTTAPQLSGTDLIYQIQFTNSGGQAASTLTILDAVPLNTDFKVGTAQANAVPTGLVFAIEYSSNYSASNPALATWTYVPASAGGGAAAGYDRNVKAARWRVTAGTLSNVAPNNTGNVSFTVKIR